MNNEFNDKIQLLKTKVNIVDIISNYIKVSKRGNNYWAVCPFHEDSNPSMSISFEKQIYKCFSCGEQGNIFIFLQKFKKLDFFSAVKIVAEIAKLDLKTFDLNLPSKKQTKNNPSIIINQLALNFFQYQLTTEIALKAKAYLKSRHINDDIINQFQLGFAPANNQLLSYLQTQNQPLAAITNSGLVKITENDKIVDLFINRIIFPILDSEGICLGFSGRGYLTNQTDVGFKYVNTPETDIFKKRAILYNLFNAKQVINNKNDVLYLVEGFMDVIALSKCKILNCVALMGTNLTKEQILILEKVTKNVIIFLDGDDAGKTAACKIAKNLMLENFNVQIIDNQTKSDPDELVNQSIEKFNVMITNPIHPIDFMINFLLTKHNITESSNELKLFFAELQPMWNAVTDTITLKFYRDKLQKISNLNHDEIDAIFSNYKLTKKNEFVKQRLLKYSITEKLVELQKQILTLVLLDRHVYEWLEKEKFIFNSKPLMILYYLVSQEYLENSNLVKINLNDIFVKLKDNEFLGYLESIIKKYYDENYQISQSLIMHYLQINKNYLIEIEIEKLKNQIPQVNEINEKIALLKQMSILKNQISK